MAFHDVKKLTSEEFINQTINYYKACHIPQDVIDKIMSRYSKYMLGLQAATPELVARIYFNYYLQDIRDPTKETFLE